MSTSKVAIANLALQKLGATRISALDQDDPNARSMNAAYDAIRRQELRKFRWGFARRRASIAADASQTEWGTHNRFSLPNDYLCLIRDDESGIAVDWQIESDANGTYIITDDAAPLNIKYVADLDDPNFYDSLFVTALACALALQCCEEITESTSKKQGIMNEYNMAISEARLQGSIEKDSEDFPEDDWLTARF